MTTTLQTMVTVNGEARRLAGSNLLTDLLRDLSIDPDTARGIAVARNEEVVPRRAWRSVQLRDGDRVEVVTAKQGG